MTPSCHNVNTTLLSSYMTSEKTNVLCLLQERPELAQSSPQKQPEAVQEELDFLFDEEMERLAAPRKNNFTDWSDDDSDDEIDDRDVNKILIVTQTPPNLRKHPGGDRKGNHESRAKITVDLAKAINDGLFYYEQDLWTEEDGPQECTNAKVRLEAKCTHPN